MASIYDWLLGNLNNFGGTPQTPPPQLNMPNPNMGFQNQLNNMMPRMPVNPNPMAQMPNPAMAMNPAPINPQTLGVNPSPTNPVAAAQGGASQGAAPGAPGTNPQDSLRKMMMAQYLASMMGGGGGNPGMAPPAPGALPIAGGGSPGGLPGAGSLQATNVMSMPVPLPPKRRFIGNMDTGYTPSTMGY